MERFVTRHTDRIAGILTGFDRMRFRGTLRSISNVKGLQIWLGQRHVLLKDFGRFAEGLSAELTAHAHALAEERSRPFEYLPSWKIRKEDRARTIRARDGIQDGLIAIFSCVEGCRSFGVRGNRQTKRLEVVSQERRCAHLYFYYWDHDFGLMHVRVQTWLPFTIQICINGREWLAQQLRRCGTGFTQVDNCVFDVVDRSQAQRLLRQLETRPWARVLRVFATRVNPLLRGQQLRPYYWSLEESEYATDVLFHDRAGLQMSGEAVAHREPLLSRVRAPDHTAIRRQHDDPIGDRHAAPAPAEEEEVLVAREVARQLRVAVAEFRPEIDFGGNAGEPGDHEAPDDHGAQAT